MTDPIGTAQDRELIERLRARSKDNWRDELGGSTCELLEEAADALQSRIAEVGRLETLLHESLYHLRLDEAAKAYHERVESALSLHRRPTDIGGS